MKTAGIKDPTRAELIEHLEGVYPEVTCGEQAHTEAQTDECLETGCGCRFDIEEAAYWLAVHYHGGGGSNLYRALCKSEYRPGPTTPDLPDDLNDEDCERVYSTMLYLAGVDWLKGTA